MTFPEIEGPPGLCPRCGALIDFQFATPLTDIPAFVAGNEWVSLGEFDVILCCRGSCGWQEPGKGTQFTIDLDKKIIKFGKLSPPKGD